MSTLMSTIWLDPRPKNFVHPHCSYLPLLGTHTRTPPNINARHKAACCAGFRILLWANLSWCSKAEGPLTPASRSAVSQQPVAMVTSALWQASAAAVAAAASCMMRPPSLNTLAIVLLSSQVAAPTTSLPATSCHLVLLNLHGEKKGSDCTSTCIDQTNVKCHQISSTWLHHTRKKVSE